jgi:polyisoprenyl-phosphate glycosyltransferase
MLNHSTRQNNNFKLSLIIPMRDEEAMVQVLLDRLIPIVELITPNYELVCVDDGSSDRTLHFLNIAQSANSKLKILSLARNFGKEIALTAGIDYVTGDAVVPIDADLQDPPELLAELVKKWRDGYDMVIAIRSDRSSDSLFKRLTATLFYRVLGSLSDVSIPYNAGDFRLMDRCVIEALKHIPERTRFMKGIFAWVGFNQTTIEYSRQCRVRGSSKWNFWKLWNFALEGIFSFTTIPLRIWTYLGLALALVAMGYMLFIIGKTLLLGIDVPGYASIIVIVLFFSGVNMIGLGIIGEYLGRVFLEVKRRPLYVVREARGFECQAKNDLQGKGFGVEVTIEGGSTRIASGF